jgi:magnesium transporter
MAMGLLLGGFLAAIGFVAALVLTGDKVSATVIGITLILVVLCGTLAGAMLPLIFHRLGLDPALMSNPFVAGIVDILGIVIYMNVGLTLMSMAGEPVPPPGPVETGWLWLPLHALRLG